MDLMQLLGELTPEELVEMFYPYEQEQRVLDQEMATGQQMQQRGPERSTPTGALLGGLANALGGFGGAAMQAKGLGDQRALGGRMQGDAANRMEVLERLLRQKRGMGGGQPAGFVGLDTTRA